MTIIQTQSGYAVEEHGELLEFASREAALAYVEAVEAIICAHTAIIGEV